MVHSDVGCSTLPGRAQPAWASLRNREAVVRAALERATDSGQDAAGNEDEHSDDDEDNRDEPITDPGQELHAASFVEFEDLARREDLHHQA